jgi:hypothetical protein
MGWASLNSTPAFITQTMGLVVCRSPRESSMTPGPFDTRVASAETPAAVSTSTARCASGRVACGLLRRSRSPPSRAPEPAWATAHACGGLSFTRLSGNPIREIVLSASRRTSRGALISQPREARVECTR